VKREADVLIVGAGTSGIYLAWRLAEAGYRCLALEREALDELGTSIGPFHMEEASFKRFGIPLPEGGSSRSVAASSWTQALNLEYEVRSDPASGMKSLPALLKGIAAGKLRPASIASIARMGMTAGAIKRLYENYPEHPVDFGAWVNKVKPPWSKADRARHDYFEACCGNGLELPL
jgi:choline dehydrogenase-like flavoprotein